MLIGTVDNSIRQQDSYATKTENRQTVDTIDKADNSSKVESKKTSEIELHDEYISGGDKPSETPGIYQLRKDENGQSKIVFDRPDSKKANGDLPSVASEPMKASESPENKDIPEKSDNKKDGIRCTVNTDNVDAEIKKLKEEKQKIEQQIQSASSDEDKRQELEQRLSQIESELSAKDNDSYRKKHATYTYS